MFNLVVICGLVFFADFVGVTLNWFNNIVSTFFLCLLLLICFALLVMVCGLQIVCVLIVCLCCLPNCWFVIVWLFGFWLFALGWDFVSWVGWFVVVLSWLGLDWLVFFCAFSDYFINLYCWWFWFTVLLGCTLFVVGWLLIWLGVLLICFVLFGWFYL